MENSKKWLKKSMNPRMYLLLSMFDYSDTPVAAIFEFLIILFGNEYQVNHFHHKWYIFRYYFLENFGGKTKRKISGSILKEVMFFVFCLE